MPGTRMVSRLRASLQHARDRRGRERRPFGRNEGPGIAETLSDEYRTHEFGDSLQIERQGAEVEVPLATSPSTSPKPSPRLRQ
jgi:hypothetical protein